MAIKPVGNENIPVLPMERRGEVTRGSLSFKQMLQEAERRQTEEPVSDGREISRMEATASASPSFPVASLTPLETEKLSPIQRRGIELAQRTLDLLEKYRQGVADLTPSPKDLGPLVESLSEEVQKLSGLAKELAPSDPLQKLVTEVGVLSAVTIWKHRQRPVF